MILTPIRRYGAVILMLLTVVFSGEALAKTHTATADHPSHLLKTGNKQVSSKKEYSRNSESGPLPDLRKYPSGTAKEKGIYPDGDAFHQYGRMRRLPQIVTGWCKTVIDGRWSPSEKARMKATGVTL
jgi:Bax protein